MRGYTKNGRHVVEFSVDEEPDPRWRFPRPLRRLGTLLAGATIRELVARIVDSDVVGRLLQGLGINRKAAAAR